MTDTMCHYPGDREQAIVSYLYPDDSDFDRAERAGFEAHLATCGRCRSEVAALNGVRASLGQWSPPSLRQRDRPSLGAITSDQAPAARDVAWWRAMPVWAQTAAALLCVGVAAGIANLDIRYGADGLRMRTGWLAAPAGSERSDAGGAEGSAPWRAEMAAFEQRLRADLGTSGAAAQPAPPVVAAVNAAPALSPEALRRVRTLVEESERRQQRELALRLAEAIRDVNAQRQADLVRIDRNIGAVQNNTGREMLRQRSEMLNYVTVRTSLQRPQ